MEVILTVLVAGERVIAHGDLIARAAKGAAALDAMGIVEGDTIALILRNDFSFFEVTLAARRLGAYPVPINWHSTAQEAAYIIADCDAKVVIAHEDLIPLTAGSARPVIAISTPSEIREAYGLQDIPVSLPNMLNWEDLVRRHRGIATPEPAVRQSIIYTSGTTGRPKGVKRAPPSPGAPPPNPAPFGFNLADPIVVLMNGPMYHSAPNFFGMAAFGRGADIVLQPRFDAEEMLALIERWRVTHMHIVPTMFVRLLRLDEHVRGKYDLSSLRHVVHGAGPCPPAIKQAMIAWWGPVINEYYGSTETGIVAWHTSEEALRKPGTVGKALPGVDVCIVDDANRALPPGRAGEIYVRPPGSDFTYLGQERSRREIDREGLVTVGDVGYLDDDGYLFLCDRKRDMIISGGVNIYPAEIESTLILMPGIRDCAAFGLPDDEFGETVFACVELQPETDLNGAEIKAWLAERIAGFKVPRGIEIRSSLPREDTGKVFKRLLRHEHIARRG